jgi:hypothetical protein
VTSAAAPRPVSVADSSTTGGAERAQPAQQLRQQPLHVRVARVDLVDDHRLAWQAEQPECVVPARQHRHQRLSIVPTAHDPHIPRHRPRSQSAAANGLA